MPWPDLLLFILHHSVTGLGMSYNPYQAKVLSLLVARTTLLREIPLILISSYLMSEISHNLPNTFIFNSIFCVFRMTE